jgi:hypothetical protein
VTLDHTNAEWADGPKVAAWLEGRVKVSLYPGWLGRAIARWRAGNCANFYTVDKVLTKVGYMPSDLPEDVWRDSPLNYRRPVPRGRKLSEGDVRDIRVRLAAGASQRELGRVFGVSQATIGSVGSGASWGHVEDAA